MTVFHMGVTNLPTRASVNVTIRLQPCLRSVAKLGVRLPLGIVLHDVCRRSLLPELDGVVSRAFEQNHNLLRKLVIAVADLCSDDLVDALAQVTFVFHDRCAISGMSPPVSPRPARTGSLAKLPLPTMFQLIYVVDVHLTEKAAAPLVQDRSHQAFLAAGVLVKGTARYTRALR